MSDSTPMMKAVGPGPGTYNLADPLYRHGLEHPENPALVLGEQTFSYGALAALAGQVAGWVAAQAPAPRALKVGVIASRSLGAFAGILGACWAGAAYVPINPVLAPGALLRIMAIAQPDALVVDAAGWDALQAAGLPGDIPVLRFEAPGDALEAPAGLRGIQALDSPRPLPGDGIAYVIFTSGTTGSPKGVVIQAHSVRHFLDFGRSLYQLDQRDRVSNFSEVSFDFSVLDLWLTWDAGAALHVVPKSQLLAPAKFIQEHELTFWASVPSVIAFLGRLGQLKEGSLPSLRHTYFCGEALPLASAEAWQRAAPNSRIDNHYGPTEATVACSLERLSSPPNTTPGRGIIAIGRPYPGMRLAILAPDGSFLPQGATGELALAGPQLAAGYLGAPLETQARFRQLQHPVLGPAIWYLTGDLAYEDGEGAFHHLGRTDSQVKVLGHRLELEEVDAHLREVSGCVSAATVAWPMHHGTADGLIAFLAGTTLAPQEIIARLKERLPNHAVPREILLLPALPLSANGKTDRQKLVAILEQRNQPHGD